MEKYKNESLVDIAYDILTEGNKIMTFKDLFDEVCNAIGLSQEQGLSKIGSFYTNLTLDGRFINLGDNIWDLRSNRPFDTSHISLDDVYNEMDAESTANTDPDEIDDEEKENRDEEDEEENDYMPRKDDLE